MELDLDFKQLVAATKAALEVLHTAVEAMEKVERAGGAAARAAESRELSLVENPCDTWRDSLTEKIELERAYALELVAHRRRVKKLQQDYDRRLTECWTRRSTKEATALKAVG